MQIVDRHPDTDVGVFFCGPAALSKTYVARDVYPLQA